MSPASMKALICERHGPPESLRFGEAPLPEPGEGEIRLRVHAAGVNFPDTLIIEDKYQYHPALPFSPGGEAAGIVDSVGPGVTGFSPGDRVAAMTTHGAFAEYLVAPATSATIVPATMDLETASAFTLAYATSHYALKQRGKLRPGETLLVLGAAGGVGLSAVELGKAMGARVIAAASSEEKLAIARDRGADETINYAEEDIRDSVKRLTGGRGADMIYDPVGDRFAEPAFRSIAWEGRFLVIGFAGGKVPALPLNLPLLKGASIVGVFWGDFFRRDPGQHRRNMEDLYRMHAEGKIRPHISERFPLARGGEAIRWMMDRKAIGKGVIIMREDGA